MELTFIIPQLNACENARGLSLKSMPAATTAEAASRSILNAYG